MSRPDPELAAALDGLLRYIEHGEQRLGDLERFAAPSDSPGRIGTGGMPQGCHFTQPIRDCINKLKGGV